MDRKLITQNLKMLWATYHFAFRSKDPKAIANAVHVNPHKLHQWMKTDDWVACLSFWGQKIRTGDLNFVEKLWTEMIENGEDLFPVGYPNTPIKSKPYQNNEAHRLIHSHLFCVDNLTKDDIHERLANEDNDGMKPVPYNGRNLENAYHYWIFPNQPDGLYSKVLARANVAGDLVIGAGEDTSLVIIRHGRLTLTRQSAADVVSVYDERLLVCL